MHVCSQLFSTAFFFFFYSEVFNVRNMKITWKKIFFFNLFNYFLLLLWKPWREWNNVCIKCDEQSNGIINTKRTVN